MTPVMTCAPPPEYPKMEIVDERHAYTMGDPNLADLESAASLVIRLKLDRDFSANVATARIAQNLRSYNASISIDADASAASTMAARPGRAPFVTDDAEEIGEGVLSVIPKRRVLFSQSVNLSKLRKYQPSIPHLERIDGEDDE